MSHIYPQNINHLKLSQIKYLNLFKINNKWLCRNPI